MATKKYRITRGLKEIGAAWAISSDRYVCTNSQCCPSDGSAHREYHIHPNASFPHVDDIKAFRNLDEIARYIEARKKADAIMEAAEFRPTEAYGDGDGPSYYDMAAEAMDVMEQFWASL